MPLSMDKLKFSRKFIGLLAIIAYLATLCNSSAVFSQAPFSRHHKSHAFSFDTRNIMHSKCKINKFTYWFPNNTNLIAFWFCSLFAPPSNCATIKLRFATLNLNTENAIVCLLQQLFELWLCQQQQNSFETKNFPSEKFFMSYTASAYTHTHSHTWTREKNEPWKEIAKCRSIQIW